MMMSLFMTDTRTCCSRILRIVTPFDDSMDAETKWHRDISNAQLGPLPQWPGQYWMVCNYIKRHKMTHTMSYRKDPNVLEMFPACS
jgi:hypothetical protein